MADKPVLFSGPMVKAILEGRKTMTRRVLKPQPKNDHFFQFDRINEGRAIFRNPHTGYRQDVRVPISIGDHLYIREAWRTEVDGYDGLAPSELSGKESILFNADADWSDNKTVGRLRPGMHMPRWASRLTLTVTDLKVECVADITTEDAEAEGWPAPANRASAGAAEIRDAYPIGWFAHLWDSLNKKRGFGWEENPWIMAVTFESHPCNIDEMAK